MRNKDWTRQLGRLQPREQVVDLRHFLGGRSDVTGRRSRRLFRSHCPSPSARVRAGVRRSARPPSSVPPPPFGSFGLRNSKISAPLIGGVAPRNGRPRCDHRPPAALRQGPFWRRCSGQLWLVRCGPPPLVDSGGGETLTTAPREVNGVAAVWESDARFFGWVDRRGRCGAGGLREGGCWRADPHLLLNWVSFLSLTAHSQAHTHIHTQTMAPAPRKVALRGDALLDSPEFKYVVPLSPPQPLPDPWPLRVSR